MRISDWSSDVCSSDLTDLDTTVNGVRNEIGLINSQRAVRNDILNRIDLPTAQSLLGQAEQSGVGVVNFNGVTFSSQELRDVANQREDYELSTRSALLVYAANEAEFADAQASRMVQRSEELTSALQSLMRISYAVFFL